MDSHTLLKEFKRFIKEQKKRYISFTLIIVLVLVLLQSIPLVQTFLSSDYEQDTNDLTNKNVDNPAVFEMYIEYDSGSVFTNTLLLEESLKTSENIKASEEATGVEISDLLDYEEKIEYPKTSKDRGALGAYRDEASNIWVFSAKVGTEKENLKVIQYFYDLIQNEEVPLLQNKYTYIISEPRVLTDEELSSSTTPVQQEDATNGISIKSIVKIAMISILGGLVLSFLVLIFLTFIDKKIKYAFNYSWNEDDIFVLISKSNIKELEKMMLLSKKQTFLAQDPRLLLNNQLKASSSITDLVEYQAVDEVIIFIQPGVTTKAWYNQQREILKISTANLKIIQINN